jgi:pimeloyl-ACP methyl ester carboxylesterase
MLGSVDKSGPSMHRPLLASLLSIAVVMAGSTLRAQTPAIATAGSVSRPNLTWKTLGGEQLWTDELVYGKWRMQRNELTGHYRLLDPKNVRRAWGTDDECRAVLALIKWREKLQPLSGPAVVTLHGLVRTRDHMTPLGEFLEQQGGFTWINVSYASTRRSIDDHAQSLARVIENLNGVSEIHFVCHSMGNLVVRRYLGEASQPQPRWRPDPRIKRMVMLGPPNNGAKVAALLADALHENDLARFLAGPSAWQLARQWDDTQKLLATPPFEFGVLAGGCGDDCGLNPLLAGDDDLLVTVAETRLPGATDFRIVNCRHGRLVDDPDVMPQVLKFLKHGYFTSADERQPIVTLETPMAAAQ